MITELMIILIVVGAIIVFVAWTSARKRRNDEDDRRDAEESTEKFRKDLEKTANEIIGRMEEQAAKMEKLLKDSERIRTQTEGRVVELRKLAKQTELQAAELKNFLTRLEDAVDDVNAIRTTRSVRTPVQRLSPPPVSYAPPKNFAAVLENSMAEPAPPKKSEHVARRVSEMPALGTNSDIDNAADSSAVREMLEAGISVEEIARETGMGRGAILLVKQMMRHQK